MYQEFISQLYQFSPASNIAIISLVTAFNYFHVVKPARDARRESERKLAETRKELRVEQGLLEKELSTNE